MRPVRLFSDFAGQRVFWPGERGGVGEHGQVEQEVLKTGL